INTYSVNFGFVINKGWPWSEKTKPSLGYMSAVYIQDFGINLTDSSDDTYMNQRQDSLKWKHYGDHCNRCSVAELDTPESQNAKFSFTEIYTYANDQFDSGTLTGRSHQWKNEDHPQLTYIHDWGENFNSEMLTAS